jgi:hypothetical protein
MSILKLIICDIIFDVSDWRRARMREPRLQLQGAFAVDSLQIAQMAKIDPISGCDWA